MPNFNFLLLNPSLADADLARLVQQFKQKRQYAKILLALKNPNASKSLHVRTFEELMHEPLFVQFYLQDNQNIPEEIVQILMRNKDLMLLNFLMQNKNRTKFFKVFWQDIEKMMNLTLPDFLADILTCKLAVKNPVNFLAQLLSVSDEVLKLVFELPESRTILPAITPEKAYTYLNEILYTFLTQEIHQWLKKYTHFYFQLLPALDIVLRKTVFEETASFLTRRIEKSVGNRIASLMLDAIIPIFLSQFADLIANDPTLLKLCFHYPSLAMHLSLEKLNETAINQLAEHLKAIFIPPAKIPNDKKSFVEAWSRVDSLELTQFLLNVLKHPQLSLLHFIDLFCTPAILHSYANWLIIRGAHVETLLDKLFETHAPLQHDAIVELIKERLKDMPPRFLNYAPLLASRYIRHETWKNVLQHVIKNVLPHDSTINDIGFKFPFSVCFYRADQKTLALIAQNQHPLCRNEHVFALIRHFWEHRQHYKTSLLTLLNHLNYSSFYLTYDLDVSPFEQLLKALQWPTRHLRQNPNIALNHFANWEFNFQEIVELIDTIQSKLLKLYFQIWFIASFPALEDAKTMCNQLFKSLLSSNTPQEEREIIIDWMADFFQMHDNVYPFLPDYFKQQWEAIAPKTYERATQ